MKHLIFTVAIAMVSINDKKSKTMTVPEINIFLQDRPQLNKHSLSKESGVAYRTLRAVLNGERGLTPRIINLLRPTMKKYGFIESKDK